MTDQTIATFFDKTSHGGRVITASTTRRANGNFVARLGDLVLCPIHGITVITQVTNDMPKTDGRPTAHEGAKTSCGAMLLRSPFNAKQGPAKK